MVCATGQLLTETPPFCDSRGIELWMLGLQSEPVGSIVVYSRESEERIAEEVTTEHDRIESEATLAVAPSCYLMRHGSQRSRSFETDAPWFVKPLQQEAGGRAAFGRADSKQTASRTVSHLEKIK
ncbi:hypothetical protein O988_04655 [Pseudogymnoascus sp. VKM F-3808]|nr:hypothetical protein O988_04655 [Pseudogymnoascus sp. VKM F-3808]